MADINQEHSADEGDMIVTFSRQGYVKRQPAADYRAQGRGGRGKRAAADRDDDSVSILLVADADSEIMIFTSLGQAYRRKTRDLPLASRVALGSSAADALGLQQGEEVQAAVALPAGGFGEGRFLIFATASGTVKKTELNALAKTRDGTVAINIDGDRLVGAAIASEQDDILLFSSGGNAVRFSSSAIRAMGRSAAGVRGMKIKGDGDRVVSMLALSNDEAGRSILIAVDNGRGKRVSAELFPVKGRGGQGVAAMPIKGKNEGAAVAGAVLAGDGCDLMLVAGGGVLARIRTPDVPEVGRTAQGYSLIALDSGDRLAAVARAPKSEEGGEEGGGEDE